MSNACVLYLKEDYVMRKITFGAAAAINLLNLQHRIRRQKHVAGDSEFNAFQHHIHHVVLHLELLVCYDPTMSGTL